MNTIVTQTAETNLLLTEKIAMTEMIFQTMVVINANILVVLTATFVFKVSVNHVNLDLVL